MDDDRTTLERDRLPVMKDLIYSWDDEAVNVRMVYTWAGPEGLDGWPDVMVRLHPRGRGITISGIVRPDGRIRSMSIEAEDEDHEVTAGAAHGLPGIISSLKEWNAVARDTAGQILSGVPEDRTVVDAKPATDSTRALLYGTQRPQGTRKRGADAEYLLGQVVAAYKAAAAAGDPTPRKTVAEQFGYSPEHIGRLLKRAREPRNGRPPLLGPAEGGVS